MMARYDDSHGGRRTSLMLDGARMPGHAAPHRDRVSLALLAFGLFGAAAAWAVQLISNYSLMAHFCYPLQTPEASPTFGGVRVLAIAISAVLLVVAVLALFTAIRSFNITRHEMAKAEDDAHSETAEVGEGRTRFLSLAGILVSGIFVYGVLMAGVPLISMPVSVF